MRIGVDVDGVLAGQVEATLPIFNQYLGTNYTVDDWNDWFFMEKQVGRDQLLRVLDNAWMQEYIMPQEINMLGSLKKIKKYGTITIITRRSYTSHPAVMKILHQWGVTYNSFVFVGSGETKLSFPIDVLIDDHPDYEDFLNNHTDKTLIVREQPWNYMDVALHLNIHRVSNLAEAENVLMNIKENYG